MKNLLFVAVFALFAVNAEAQHYAGTIPLVRNDTPTVVTAPSRTNINLTFTKTRTGYQSVSSSRVRLSYLPIGRGYFGGVKYTPDFYDTDGSRCSARVNYGVKMLDRGARIALVLVNEAACENGFQTTWVYSGSVRRR